MTIDGGQVLATINVVSKCIDELVVGTDVYA